MAEQKKSKEIDVLAMAMSVLEERKTLAVFVIVAAVVGVIVALATPRTYRAQVVLAPELSSGGIGLNNNMADLASTFGINMSKNTTVDAIYPEIYPEIFSSTDFIKALYDIKVRTKDDDTPRTFYYHMTKEQKAPFWTYPQSWIIKMMAKSQADGNAKGNDVDHYRISKQDAELCEAISGLILCEVDKKTSVITISYTDQDPLVASIMVDTLHNRLQEYITAYRTKKARADYEFYKAQAAQMKREYERSRNYYVTFADANQEAQLESVVRKTAEMEDDMQQKYDSYKNLLNSMRQANAKIQENTPAFTIIQRPMMPHRPSSRSRIQTVLIFILLGVLADSVWVLFLRKAVKTMRKQ